MNEASFWNRGATYSENVSCFFKSKVVTKRSCFSFTFIKHVQNKARRINKRLFFSCDNDGEQKMFQQAEPLNKKMFIQAENSKARKKKRIFITWISCQPSWTVVELFVLSSFFSLAFSPDKENLRRYFHANHSRRIWAGATFFSAQCCFSEETKENKMTAIPKKTQNKRLQLASYNEFTKRSFLSFSSHKFWLRLKSLFGSLNYQIGYWNRLFQDFAKFKTYPTVNQRKTFDWFLLYWSK